MIKLGICGMAGAGKSTLRDLFKEDGAFVVNLDEVGHGFYSDRRGPVYAAVVERFGGRVNGLLTRDGAIDRKSLGEYVFADASALEELNSIFYGEFYEFVRKLAAEMEALRRTAGGTPGAAADFFVLDAAVLFDAGLDALMDRTVWVEAPADTLVARLVEGRKIEPAYARSMVEAQLRSCAGFRGRADHLIHNGGGAGDLKTQYLKLIKEIRENVKKK